MPFNLYSIKLNKIKSFRYEIIVIIFCIAGFIFRYNNLPGEWMSDTARDFLYAKHIVYYKEFPFFGPYAMGTKSFYSPYYYYLLSVPLIFNPDLFFLLTIIVLINSLSILFVYLIASACLDKKAGIIASLFFTLSSSHILYGSTLWSAYLVIPPALLGILFFTKFLINKKKIYFRLSFLVISLSGLIHYSVISLIPAFLLWTFFKKIISFRAVVFNALVSMAPAVLLHIPLLISQNQFFPVTPRINVIPSLIYFITPYKLWKNFLLFLKSVFLNDPNWILITFALAVLSVPMTAYKYNYQSKTRSALFFINLIIIVFLISAPLIINQCCSHFFTVISPLFLISAAITVRYLFIKTQKNSKLIFIYLPVLIIFFYLLLNTNPSFKNYYQKINNLSEKITDDIRLMKKKRNIENNDFFQALYFQDYSSNESYEVWYFLENNLKSKIIAVKNHQITLTGRDDFVYVLCDKRDIAGCRRRFTEIIPGHFQRHNLWQEQQYQIFRYEKVRDYVL